jgi:hypothetical protein
VRVKTYGGVDLHRTSECGDREGFGRTRGIGADNDDAIDTGLAGPSKGGVDVTVARVLR